MIGRRTVRIGVTGLARAGKTALLTSVAANLLALGAGGAGLPALQRRLQGRRVRVSVAPAGASSLPRFDHTGHLASLAGEPARWPERTSSVSLLALDIEIQRTEIGGALPPRRLRLELLDYPGEWLLDLPLLGQSYQDWSAATWRRLERPELAAIAREFLAFAGSLPARTAAEEPLAATGHALYRALLAAMRDTLGLSLLQPGRMLLPAPGPEPPWSVFFPIQGHGPLIALMQARYDAYRQAVARDLVSPGFGRIDRLVVLADVLSALHAGRAAFEDMAASLAAVAAALHWRKPWTDRVPMLGRLALPNWLQPGGIRRVAFVATKADHVATRQRGNLAALTEALTTLPGPAGRLAAARFAIAAMRCTEDFVWTLDGRNISAVRGRVLGDSRLTRSYPGEVPDGVPDAGFWAHPFLALPQFEPMQVPVGGRLGVSHIALDEVLTFLLDDVL